MRPITSYLYCSHLSAIVKSVNGITYIYANNKLHIIFNYNDIIIIVVIINIYT